MNTRIFSRFALFLIYFWFGLLKVIGSSPANPLVVAMIHKIMPMVSVHQFIIVFGIFEMIIGALFLIPKYTKFAKILFFLHMITTCLPLVLLQSLTWQSYFIPTLEGQYIIKNIALIALVLTI